MIGFDVSTLTSHLVLGQSGCTRTTLGFSFGVFTRKTNLRMSLVRCPEDLSTVLPVRVVMQDVVGNIARLFCLEAQMFRKII